jgi:hypothetical protein
MLSGMIILYAANPMHKNNFFTNHLKSNDALIFTIINEPKIGEYNIQLQAKITHVGKPHHWKNASGKLLIKLKKSALKNLPNIGDVFLIWIPRLIGPNCGCNT